MKIQETLKTHFGYDTFRPLQEEIVRHVLAKKDALVIMPTGGGKSLCYQLPALQMAGLTLVISPLIALMKDQVDALQANGIAAELINSSLTSEEIKQIQNRLTQKQIKILYVAPERLAMPDFRHFLGTLSIDLIAIDEAHCISEWGHDFRPDYRNLRSLRQDFAHTPIIALTATATFQVRKDIIEQLHLGEAKTFLSSFNRDNLIYRIKPKKGMTSQLVEMLKPYERESAIVYCFSRKSTEELAMVLRGEGFKALPYHAGLLAEERKKNQEKFIRDEASVMVATIAFGMGIDKPNVRLVVHADMPRSVESYYQETGRAGRDGLKSECVLFYSYGDKMKHDFFIRQMESAEQQKAATEKLQNVLEYAELQTCRRSYLLKYFGEETAQQICGGCDNCLTPLEEFDSTEIGYKILSTVIRTGERFGAQHIADVMRGKPTVKVLSRGHEKLSVFGIAQERETPEIQGIIRLLEAKKLLVKNSGEYPTLMVSEDGRRVLRQREKIVLAKPKNIEVPLKTPTSDVSDYHQALFEQLRALRKSLADQKHVPPFVIFGDVSLREMSCYLPQNHESFSRITGVGSVKLAEYGDAFLSVIQAYARNQGNLSWRARTMRKPLRVNEKPGMTHQLSKQLFEKKLSLRKIAQMRNLTEDTIVHHLEKLIESGQKLDLDYLQLPTERFEKIKNAFAKSGDLLRLSPVKEILGEEFSYCEIRLARIFLRTGAVDFMIHE